MPPAAGFAAIKSYEIEFTEDAGANWTDVVTLTGATLASAVQDGTTGANTEYEYDHTGREAGSTLQYRVRGHISASLFSEWAPSNIVSTSPGVAPVPPTRLNATPFNDSQINLSWVKPADPAGAPVTGYRIDVSTTGDDASWSPLVADTDSTDTTYEHTGLSAETTRYYRVYALNNSPAPGRSEASNVANATTLAAGEGGTTTPVGEELGKASGISEGSFNSGGTVQIDWTAAPNAGGYVIYAVNVAQINDPVVTRAVNNASATTWNLDGLTVGQTYDVYVVATASGQDAQWPDAAVRVTAAQ
jgi:titin